MARIINGKKKASNLREWLIWQIRRLSYRWPARGQAFANARCTEKEFRANPGVDPRKVSARIRMFFECAICGRVFPRREVSADHIEPVVDPRKGWEGWDRSEERRVGKECRSRWSTEHEKKKEKKRRA